jgi:hypothetical protein
MRYPRKPFDHDNFTKYGGFQDWSHLAEDGDDAGQQDGADEYTPSGSDAGVLKREEKQRKWLEIKKEIERMEALVAYHTVSIANFHGKITTLHGDIANITAPIAQKKAEMATL